MFDEFFQADGLSPVERVQHNRRLGSAAYERSFHAYAEHPGFVQNTPLRSNPFLHPLAYIKELWAEANVERIRHKKIYSSQADREIHLDNKKSAVYKHGVDQRQVVADARLNQAAQAHLRRCGVEEFAKAANAVDRVISRFDRSLTMLKDIHDEEGRKKAERVFRFFLEDTLEVIQMVSFDRDMQQDGREGGL